MCENIKIYLKKLKTKISLISILKKIVQKNQTANGNERRVFEAFNCIRITKRFNGGSREAKGVLNVQEEKG